MRSKSSSSSRNVAGILMRSMWPVVKLLRNVFCSSIASRSRRVMKSARPTPIALPCEASASDSAAITRMTGLVRSSPSRTAAVADNVRVHAGAAERFADRIDDQHIDMIERQPRKIMAVPFDQLGLAPQDVGSAARRAARPFDRSRLPESPGRPRSCPSRAPPCPFRAACLSSAAWAPSETSWPRAFCPCRRRSFS